VYGGLCRTPALKVHEPALTLRAASSCKRGITRKQKKIEKTDVRYVSAAVISVLISAEKIKSHQI